MVHFPILRQVQVDDFGLFPGSDEHAPGPRIDFHPGLTLVVGARSHVSRDRPMLGSCSSRASSAIAAARKRGRNPGRPPLDPETVSAAQKLIEAGLSPARAAKQLGIGRATAYKNR